MRASDSYLTHWRQDAQMKPSFAVPSLMAPNATLNGRRRATRASVRGSAKFDARRVESVAPTRMPWLLRHGLHDDVVADLVRHRIRQHAARPEPLVVELEVLAAVDQLHERVIDEVAPLGIVFGDHAGVGLFREEATHQLI